MVNCIQLLSKKIQIDLQYVDKLLNQFVTVLHVQPGLVIALLI